jgi:macrolide transport system ATP-binding/permease protein
MGRLLIEAEGIQVAFGPRMVLDIEKFELRDGDRIALVGENGAGKTTLLKVLSGELAPDSGRVRTCDVAIIRQEGEAAGEAGAEMARRFSAPGRAEHLSGGEQARRRIAAALSANAQALFADEPTSDLDQSGIALLTEALKKFEGALLMVSHDRALMDDVATAVAELAGGKLTLYPGNYSAYRQALLGRRAFERAEYEKFRAEQARLRKTAQHMAERASSVSLPGRMGNSEARLHRRAASASQARHHQARKSVETRLEKLPQKQRPREDPAILMQLIRPSGIVSRMAVEARSLSLRAGDRLLLKDALFCVPTGSRTALVGPNGCGKTTLIRQIVKGGVPVSPGVKIGLLDQDFETLDPEATALENAMRNCVQPQNVVRTVLARLGLRGDAALKKTRLMSGGERVKTLLTRLMVSDANFLILDEPTNHLDVFSLEALGEVLSEYAGTLLVVSHDRRFIEQVATRIVRFCDGRLETFEGPEEPMGARKAEPPAPDRMILEMRMAEMAARLSKPRKGDNPEKLKAEYDALMARYRLMNEEGAGGGPQPRR